MKRPAFTIIEVLTIISIIALLLAIMLPVLQSSRQGAKTTLCASNIRQLLLGLTMYDNENRTLPYAFDDTTALLLPPADGYPGNHTFDRMGWWWFNCIEEFIGETNKKNSIIQCPSKHQGSWKLQQDILCGNYGVNQSICKSSTGRRSQAEFIGSPLRFSDITKPTETLLIVDSGYSMINWRHAADEPPSCLNSTIIEDAAYIPGLKINEERELWPGQQQDAINGRHPNKTVNVGFTDGHISRKKADDLLVEKTDEGYKNRSPLWRPKQINLKGLNP